MYCIEKDTKKCKKDKSRQIFLEKIVQGQSPPYIRASVVCEISHRKILFDCIIELVGIVGEPALTVLSVCV